MNKMIQKIKFFILSCLVVTNITVLFAQNPAPKPGGMPGFPQMSEAEMKQLEAELNELNKMLEGLSPEEQEQVLDSMVQEAMEEVKKELSDEGKELLDKLEKGDISDEDFDKLLNELIPSPDKKAEEKPAPVEQKKEMPKAEPKPLVTSKHEEARERIASLVNHINLFIVKAGSIHELPGKVERWEKKNKITWQAGLSWNSFKSELEKLVAQLNKVIEQDKKTKGYPHIDELLKNESLYNNLSKVEKSIAQSEPKIEEVAPLDQKISKDSKQAIQKTISQLIEALYTLNLPQDLTALFEKFAPTAQKKRESEEAATKKAAEESKKPRVPGSPISAGTPAGESYYTPPIDDYDYFPPYDSSYDSGSDFGALNDAPYYPTTPETRAPAPSSSGGKQPSATFKTAEKKSPDLSTDIKADEKSEKKPSIHPAIKKEKESIDKAMGLITTALDDVAATIQSSSKLKELNTHLKSDEPTSNEIVNAASMITLASAKTVALIDNLHTHVTQPRAIKARKADLEKAFKKHEATFNQLIQDLNEAEKLQPTISTSKQAAYFGKDPLEQFEKIFEELGMTNRINELKVLAETKSPEEAFEQFQATLSETERRQINEKAKEVLSRKEQSITLPELKKAVMSIKETIDSFDTKKQ